MAKLFFLLSGEHKILPFSELNAILCAEGYGYKVLEKLDQVVRLEADLGCVEAAKRRAAFTRLCGLELFSCKAEMREIKKFTYSADLDKILEAKESFAVRVKRVKNYASTVDRMSLERKLGESVLAKTTNTKVNLKNPDRTFIGVLTNEEFIFGVKLAEILPKPFVDRSPKKKPFFHPSAMQAKLARCMTNLARPIAGELVLDPLCGTGSILVEAALIGCRVLGSDVKRRMAKGAFRNMVHFHIDPEGILVTDARSLPIKHVDCVVTDPPYGRSATTLKRSTRQIVEEVLKSAHNIIRRGRRVCMATPRTLNIGHMAKTLGYEHSESHLVYVHRSLTREIGVFEKV